MAGRNSMTFNASLRLNSKNFQKGVSEVQRSLKSLRSSFLSVAGALGLGLSFGKLGNELLDTATKLSVAKNTLQNVSKEFGEYGQNLEWLRKISNEYGQDMITLIKSFAQFRAAASSSKLTLDQMRDVYEALTRAAGAFHLSSQDTNNMMMAVTQMLSKGKVAAEELRRQLGNVLPGAFNIMAKAAYNAGIITKDTTAALEDAMKAGKVSAEQVLPEFAKQLNEVTANADFESLQTSMNRLKNSWTEMVEDANFEGLYKGIIDNANKVVQYFTTGFWTKISTAIAGVFGSTVVARGLRSFVTDVRNTRIAAEKEFDDFFRTMTEKRKKIENMPGGSAIRNPFVQAQTGPRGKDKALIGIPAIDNKQLDALNLSVKQVNDLRKATSKYYEDLLKMSKAQERAMGKPFLTKDSTAMVERLNKNLKETVRISEQGELSFKNINGEVGMFGTVGAKLASAWRGFVGILKSAFASFAVGAIIAGITFLISKLIEARKETTRIKNIVSDMEGAVEKASGNNSQTLIGLTRVRKELEAIDKAGGDASKKKMLIDQVNKSLGLTGDRMLTISDDIKGKVLPAIDDYIKGIKEAARQQAILAQVNSATSRIIQLEAENDTYRNDPNYNQRKTHWVQTGSSMYGGQTGTYVEGLTNKAQRLENKIQKNTGEIEKLNEGIDRLLESANNDTLAAIYGGRETISSTEDYTDLESGSGDKKATPSSVMKDYKEELTKLDNQYKSGAILAADYKKKVEELNQKAFQELSEFGWEDALKGLSTNGDRALAESIKSMATAKLLEGLDDPKEIAEFDKAMEEEAKAAYEKFRDAWNRFLEYRKKMPLIDKSETTDDYMLSRKRGRGQSFSEYDTHLINEGLDAYKKYVDDLEDYRKELNTAIAEMTDPESVKRLNELLAEVIAKLELAKLVVKDLKDKANIAQLEKDISDLQKQGIDSIFGSITSVADGMDRLYRAIQSVKQINDDTWQSEELENFLTRLNAIIQAFEVMKSIIEAVRASTEIYAKIKEKNAMKIIALNNLEAASETKKGAAAAGAAAAGAASATASIPIVGPALAIAAIAGITAAIIAAMSKFAQGGLVSGPTTGDKNVVRVNGGEMILNKQQQANLFNAIKSGNLGGGGGQVDFKIRGADLVGVLQNYDRRTRGY